MANEDWIFNVGNNRNTKKVIVHLDNCVEPKKTEIVNELVKYICAFENIKKYTDNKTAQYF